MIKTDYVWSYLVCIITVISTNNTISYFYLRLNGIKLVKSSFDCYFSTELLLSEFDYIFLFQIIDVENSTVSINLAKVEIKLRKKTLGSWSKLEIPQASPTITNSSLPESVKEPTPEPQVEGVDLNFI